MRDTQGAANIPLSDSQDDMSAGSGTQQLADKAKQGAAQVKQSASAATDQAKQTAMSQAASQKDQAAESLNTVSQAVNQAAQQLRQNNQAPVAQVAESAASNISQLAEYLRSRSINDLIGDVEEFASSQPALFLGGAFLVGVLGARFLKSSRAGMSQPRTSSGYRSSNWRGQYGQTWGPQTGQYAAYGNQYASPDNLNNPGVGANVNTGGLAYGRNLSPDQRARQATGATGATDVTGATGTFATYPTDDDVIAGDAPLLP